MRLSSKFFVFFMILMMMPLASADITLHLQKIDSVGEPAGSMLQIPADITNNGVCPLECYYNYSGLTSDIDSKIGSDIQGRFDFTIQLKVPTNPQPYQIEVKAICQEQKDTLCAGNIYEASNHFNFFNMPLASSQQTQTTTQNQNTSATSNQTQNGFNAAHVGEFIGVVLVIIAAIALTILFIFGFYKLIRFLFFRREKKAAEGEEGRRKLSAIMFTDMKGFSKEMGQNEEKTLRKLWRYEKAMKNIIKEHDGRVVKTIGDAIMGDFDSAVNAVKSAMEIQSILAKEDIKIRIGIHLGDVIHKAGDIFGDGVNIASRIESICEPGEIYISEDVYSQVKGKIQANFQNLGNRPLKNIDSPPRVYKVGKK